jgi:single-stranded-DNA-specific exonuclease
MKYRWSLAVPQPLLAGQLANQLKLPPLLMQCLLNRDFTEPDPITTFLQPRLKQLADPFLLPDMAAAVDRLMLARERQEQVIVFGDYDVDGVTSTALLLEVLRALGWSVEYYLPHRMDEGYGLSQDAVENCLRKIPARLLLAVDCGSTTVDSVAWLRQQGVAVIVLDHHQVSNPAPAAVALVNPHRREQDANGESSSAAGNDQEHAPFRELCSVGLAFKLAHALVKRGRATGLPGANEYDLRPLLDLVALGTIADIVPLIGENRILVSAGLQRLNTTTRPGLVALKKVAQCPTPVGVHEAGFQLAPRLNAAGRLETAESALRLLLAGDLNQALPLAKALDAINRERQKLERTIVEHAVATVNARFKPETDLVIVEGQAEWHVGVVGIVAARVLQRFYRPTIIVGGDGEHWRGSGRSVPGFDLGGALRHCGDLLVRHGGHAMAAGLTVQPDKLGELRGRLNQLAAVALKPELLRPALQLDAEVGLEEMTLECLKHLGQLRPSGQGNPAVQFCARNVSHQRPLQRLGPEKQHVKMWVTDGTTTQEAVWWGGGNESLPVGRFDVAFTPQVNEYNGRRCVQLKVIDWRAAEAGTRGSVGV